MSSTDELRQKYRIGDHEFKVIQKIFMEYDADRDGYISKIEARNCLDRLCIAVDSKFNELFKQTTSGGQNKMDINCFLDLIHAARGDTEKKESAFQQFSQAVLDIVAPSSGSGLHLHSQAEQNKGALKPAKKSLEEIKIEECAEYRMFDSDEDLDFLEQSVDVLASPIRGEGNIVIPIEPFMNSNEINEIMSRVGSTLEPIPENAVVTDEESQGAAKKRGPLAVTKSEPSKIEIGSDSSLQVDTSQAAIGPPDEFGPQDEFQKTTPFPTSAKAHARQKKKQKGPTKRQMNALMNPSVRKQILSQKPHKPVVMVIMAVVLVAMMIAELAYNGGFESFSINPMGGPSAVTLVRLGGKYVPCMKPNATVVEDEIVPCYVGFNGLEDDGKCTYYPNAQFLCGMGGFSTLDHPNQWWRFITPIFLHVGLIHLILNMSMLLRTGIQLERVIGSVRMFILYFLSGLGGNLFSAIMAPKIVSVGASSSLYGFYGMMLLDLIQNWPLLSTPYRDLCFLLLNIIISLAIGLLPFIDNYAHIGGFVTGLLSGVVFMPRIFFSKWDRRRKLISAAICLPLVVAGLAYGFTQFYTTDSATEVCPWCVYLDCVPPNSAWCAAEQP